MLLNLDLVLNAFLDRLSLREEESRQQATLSSQASPSGPPPWETWDLDKTFFTALSRWTLDHPETTLDRALENISIGLENAKDLFSLIPDNPFPARGLVTALAHLFKLGVTISGAKKDVQGFAKDVVNWVGQVKVAFESANGGRFTGSAWRDLRRMRDLVEEICRWAVARLEDRRWARVGHGLMIQKEIGEFRARIADARGLFQDLSAINLARGMDSIKRDIRVLLKRDLQVLLKHQLIVLAEIEKIRQTQQDQLSYIMDEMEAQKQTAARERFFSQTLATRTVANPTYDKQGKRPCDEGTRVEVLTNISKWANDISPGSQNFLWLTGDPGCGKSAITASLARECKGKGILWAQFFINRNNAETTDPNAYFPSIARQFADRSPDVAQAIHDTLKREILLMEGISAEQAAKLFVNSVRVASLLEPERPVVVVIDGLDETDRTRLKDTATIFSTLFAALSAHSNIKVFISSRTEDAIRNPFANTLHSKHVKHIHLNTSDPSSLRDVSIYILRCLKRIVEEHDLNWEVWPGDRRATALGDRASGLFLWAVTAVKLVQEQIESNGAECLNELLALLTIDALHDINALYELILRVTLRDNAPEWEFERFRRIIGAIVFLQEPLCLDDLAELLDLRKTRANDRVDVPHFVRRLRTVLVAGTDAIDGKTIPRLHKSFFEFITSTHVDARFRVDPEYANLELAVQCLRQLGAAHAAMSKLKLPVALRYACHFWSIHLSQTIRKTMVLAWDDTQATMPLAQPASLLLHISIIQPPLMLDISLPKSRMQLTLEKEVRLWDIARDHELPRRHTESVTCLAFSPDGRQLVTCSTDKNILFWDVSTGQLNGTSIKYSNLVLAVSFSPRGKYIVSASSDHTLCLWNARTGLSVRSPFYGHTGPVTCVAFSNNEEYIISGSADKTCRVWNVETGQSIGEFSANSSGVTSVAFERSSIHFHSATDDGTIRRRHAIAHSVNWENVNAHEKKVTSVACSSATLASGSEDGTVRHWDIRLNLTPRPIGYPIKEHKSAVLCVAVSPDGQHVFSGSNDTICISTVGGARRLTRCYHFETHTSWTDGQREVNPDRVTALAFSRDMRYFACAGLTVRVYELRFHEEDFQLDIVETPLQYDLLRTPSTDATPSRAFSEELDQMLSNVEEGWIYDDKVNGKAMNSRLEGIRWFKPKTHSKTKGSSVLWALFDDRIVRADSGSVAVWDATHVETPVLP